MFRGILQRSMVQSLLGLSVSLAWRSFIFLFVCRAAGFECDARAPTWRFLSQTKWRHLRDQVQVRVNFVCFLSSLSCYCHASQTLP